MPRPSSRLSLKTLLPLIVSLLGGTAIAQTASESILPVLPTKLQYASPLKAYQAYADEPVQSWREANDRVSRIGGWRTYAREASNNEPVKTEPAANPHAGHHGAVKP